MKAKFFALMAVVLAVVSCQKDVDSLDVNMGGNVATISVTLPENAITRAAADETNSAWSGLQNVKGETLRVIFQVYDEKGETNENLRQVKTLTEGNTVANFDVRLVPDRKYTFVAWADQVDATTKENNYFNVDDLKNVQILDWDAMDECRDAYTATHTEEKFNSASNITLELTRPFAKLRVVTTDMAELGYLGIAPAEAEVEYTVALPIAFNAYAGEAGTTTTNKTFANFNIAEYNQDAANTKTLFTDYILVPANNVVKFSLKTMQAGGREIKTNNFNTDIPVKRNNLTTIAGNILTDGNNINVEVKPEFDGEHSINGDSQKVEETLKQNLKNINIDLTEDIALNGNGVKWGGENTELIVIDGKKLATTAATATGASNGNHTLTLNTTYRLHIETVNPNAKVIFRNLNITTNKESGTWDTYDIQFNCNVDIENVNFQKAIAFVKDGQSVTMKDVTINETHDYYAMWISAVGQTINIDNLVVNSEGRGIKIDEEYLNAAEIAKVNLNIDNAKFITEKKAAIMVKTVEGANITLSNIDITGVKQDTVNAVWIDEDAKDCFDKVTVVGGSMAIEGKTTIKGEDAQTTFANAVKEANAVVQLSAGEYTIPANIAEGVTIICEQGTVFNNPSKMNLNGATIIGAKFNSDNSSIVNSGQVNGTFKNCVFEGKNVFRYGYVGKTCVFEDCYFKENGSEWVFHFDGVGTGVTDAEIICRRCTFDGKRVAIAGVVKNLVMEDCTFVNGSYFNTYCNTTITGTSFETSIRPLGNHAIYNNCEYYGNALKFEDLTLFADYDCKITVDDVDYALASSVANLENYVNNATRDINVYITKTLMSKDVTLKQKENVNVYVTSWGDKKSFGAATLYIHGNARYDGAETMTFENIHFSSFATRDLISSDSTESVERYAHNLTFKNCFFEGDNGIDVVGLRLRQAYNITIENCETRNLHSLGQITSVVGLTVKNTTVNAFRGFNLLTSAQDAVFEGVTINATKEDGYGIRVDAAAGSEMTIKNSAITAYEPIVLRNAQAGFVLDMKGNNTITANGEYQLVINGETPTLIGAEGLTTNLQ